MSMIAVTPGETTVVTLNRPEVRNALDETLIAELTAWAHGVRADGSVRVVILQGAGQAFSAGADLNWMSRMAGYTREENLEDARKAALMFHTLDTLPVPVIGRIHGAALGGGAGLAAICDIVVSSDDAMFGFTETTLGILPALIAPYVLRKIGISAARQYCVSGARFGAVRAKEIGLVHTVVPAAELDDAVAAHVTELRRTAPSAVAAVKRLLTGIHGKRPSDVLALTVDAITTQRVSDEGQEGMRAFLDKRTPAWADRAPAASIPAKSPDSKRRA